MQTGGGQLAWPGLVGGLRLQGADSVGLGSVGLGLGPPLPGPSTGLPLGFLGVPSTGWGAGSGSPGTAGTSEGPAAELGAGGRGLRLALGP